MLQKIKPYLLNTFILTIMLIVIAIIMGFAPFGPETMLTVDLGQQYIDFFSLFRQTLLEDPEMFFYSFEKAIGGEMVGLWAYYLMSPFNLIFLLFDESNLEHAVTLITYLKIIASSLTMMYFTRSKYQLSAPSSTLFSISYALMSYLVVYVLNIMWLDGLILLPLIALGLDQVMTRRKSVLYVLSLALMLVANYYIGYMICIFLAMYALYATVERQTRFSIKQTALDYLEFIKQSIIAVLISAIMLLPTLISLLNSKAEHADGELSFEVAHTLPDMASKLFIGSFNFDEMSAGSPNLYAGMLVLLLFLFYFFNKKIKPSEKIVTLLITGAFYLSFRYEFIDQLWHGGQFPIWYHFRFSFTTTFMAIVIAVKAFKNRPKTYSLPLLIGGLVFIAGFAYFYYTNLEDYEFLSNWKIFISFAFFLIFLVILQFSTIQWKIREWLLLGLVVIEITANASFILGEMSYVDTSKFRDYVSTLDSAVAPLKHGSDDFYRINKTFMRTKNEAMYTHYNGLDHFGSTIEAHLPELYGYLGLPDGNGFVTYTNGTLFTDDFFNMRYHLDVAPNDNEYTSEDEYNLYQEATDLDIQAHPIVDTQPRYVTHENEERLGLAMEVEPSIASPQTEFNQNDPVGNQELLLDLLDFSENNAPYFQAQPFENVTYENVEVTDRGDGDYFTYENQAIGQQDAWVELTFETDSDNPYYFTMPSQFDDDNVDLSLNGREFRFYTPYRRRQLMNASYQLIDGNQRFRFELKENDLQANLINLYEFDEERYNAMISEKQANLFDVTSFKHNEIEGTITTELDDSYLLFTIPYDSNWSVTVDGEEVETEPVLNDTLLAVPVNQGTHNIRLHYFPTAFIYGGGLSILGIGLLSLDQWYRHKKRKKADVD